MIFKLTFFFTVTFAQYVMKVIQDQITILESLNNETYYLKNTGQGFGYQLWSRYNPLQKLTQVGQLGIFDSDCYHSHNVVAMSTNIRKLIFYTCFDSQSQSITSNVKYLDDYNQYQIISAEIEPTTYENIWFFFSTTFSPYNKFCQIQIVKCPGTVIIQQELTASNLFEDYRLQFYIGGGLWVIIDTSIQTQSMKFSFSPGLSYVSQTQKLSYTALSRFNENSCRKTEESFACKCVLNKNILVFDSVHFMKNQLPVKYISEYPNCNYFQLAGWIKIDEIVSDGNDFSYKLIKITTDSQSIKLTDDNLSPFNLIYFFSNSGNKIIFTTYSYTFPSVNLDFSSNPFLITNELKINNDIYLWHYFSVQLVSDQLTVMFEFHEDSNIYTYQKIVTVRQFHIVSLLILFGNLFEKIDNYINFQLNRIQFSNCDALSFEKVCQSTCSSCDGPTRINCLGCSIDSLRIYFPELKECVCPFNSIDDIECQTLTSLNFQINILNVENKKCPYGYFEVDENCFQCLLIVTQQQINCVECLLNSEDWIDMLYCQNSLTSINSQTYTTQQGDLFYFTFSGYGVEYCPTCKSSCQDIQCMFEAKKKSSEMLDCQQYQNEKCYSCDADMNCDYCEIVQTKLVCTTCHNQYQLKDGRCVAIQSPRGSVGVCFLHCAYCQNSVCLFCFSAYYLNHDKSECMKCQIMNCKYCFEYLDNELTRSTLRKDFNPFLANDMNSIKTGCSLCFEGFNFDFTSGKCIRGKPLIQNCLRSYIDLTGAEVCLLAEGDKFSIANQITNCSKYVDNCEQCLLTTNQFIKCIICQNGYSASATTGHCTPCHIQNSKSCIEGDYRYQDYWVQLIQSFIMLFTPDLYLYPKPIIQFIGSSSLACIEGYTITKYGICKQNCDQNCLECVEEEQLGNFICKRCLPNYYGQQVFSVQGGSCLICPLLCLTCEVRPPQEILLINPIFIIDSANVIYTYRCLKGISNEKIQIDQEFHIAKYCFEEECNGSLASEFLINCSDDYGVGYFNIPDFQNNRNIEFYNQHGMKYFSLTLIIYGSECHRYVISLQTILKQKIFSLKFITLNIIGRFQTLVKLEETYISTFDSVNFQYILFSSQIINIGNDKLPIDLSISDSTFSGVQNQFLITICNNFFLKNVTLENVTIQQSVWLKYISNMNEKRIEVDEFIIINSQFHDVTLFHFFKYQTLVRITKLKIKNSNFSNSTLINLNEMETGNSHCVIDQIEIIGCNFTASTIVQNSGLFKMQLTALVILKSIFIDSVIIISQGSSILFQARLEQNFFQSSIFFYSTLQPLKQTIVSLDQFNISSTTFSNSSLFYLFLQDQQTKNLIVLISNFTLIALQNSDDSNKLTYLFDIQCYELQVINMTILNSKNIPYFRIYQTNIIIVANTKFENQVQSFKIPQGQNCLTHLNQFSILLFIQGLSSLTIKNISILNQYSIDYSVIHIISDLLFQPTIEESINLSQITFFGNILLKKDLGSIFSLLSIYSGRQQQIKVEKFNFQENFFHQLIDDPSDTSAALIYFDSLQSVVILEKSDFVSNGLTNSSMAFIAISSRLIIFENFTFANSNSLIDQIWQKYYFIPANFFTNEILISYIQQIYIIQNMGGACQLQASQIQFNNLIFYNLFALANPVLKIITQGQGIITLSNISIIKASIILSQIVDTDSSISIYSTNSLLKLSLHSIYFQEVYNRLGQAILTIYPSSRQNYIDITNITIINCFSLLNQILKIEFLEQSLTNNQVLIKDFNFSSTELGLNDYLSGITFPSSIECNKIIAGNALINLKECSITLQNCYFTGILLQQILLLSDTISLKISNFTAERIKILFPFNLLQFSQTKSHAHKGVMHNMQFNTITQLFSTQENQTVKIISTNFTLENCNVIQVDSKSQDIIKSINSLANIINQNRISSGAIISISNISSQSQILLNHINIFNNECQFCNSGMISILTSVLARIIINEFNCLNNKIDDLGCLAFTNTNITKQISANKIKISNSFFLKNQGQNGTGIYTSNVFFTLKNSIFTKNNCSNSGGAIYMENITNNFLFQEVKIIENYANQGGGIFIKGDSSLTNLNFIQSILLFNTANLYSDNLVETPDHLALMINNQEMQSLVNNNIQIMKITPYFCFEQGQLILTPFLMVPSNQKILDYSVFNMNTLLYQSYIRSFVLYYKNQLNELLEGNQNFQCQILQYPFSNSTWINFDSNKNGFDLGQLTFSFDPYSVTYSTHQLQFNCQSLNQIDALKYQLTVKSFKCQLGEFYVDEGCSICESSQGFYSVQYNASKCSIFDKTRFENITSNQIKLKGGYWRPNYLSDQTEECYKKQESCVGGWNVGDNICYSGHIGGLCEECDIYNTRGDGDYFKTNNSLCILCENGSIFSFVAITLWSFFSILLTLKSIKNSNKAFAQLKSRTILYATVFKLSQDFEGIFIKMLLNYLWIFSVIFTFNITFNISIGVVDQVSSPSYYMAMNLDCQLSSLYSTELSYVRIVAMLVFTIIQVIVISSGFKCYTLIKNEEYDYSVISITVIYIFVQNQSTFIAKFASLIAVRQISGLDYIQGNVALQFYNKQHVWWRTVFIYPGLIILGVFIPLFLLLILYINNKDFNILSFRRHLSYLFNDYNNNNYFWELIKVLKRTMIIIFLTYFETNVYVKAFLISLTLFCYLLLSINNRPYVMNLLNSLDIESTIIVSITILISALKYASEQSNLEKNISTLLTVVIILLCVRLCYYFILNILRTYYKKYRMKGLTYIFTFAYSVKFNSSFTIFLQKMIIKNKQQQDI